MSVCSNLEVYCRTMFYFSHSFIKVWLSLGFREQDMHEGLDQSFLSFMIKQGLLSFTYMQIIFIYQYSSSTCIKCMYVFTINIQKLINSINRVHCHELLSSPVCRHVYNNCIHLESLPSSLCVQLLSIYITYTIKTRLAT